MPSPLDPPPKVWALLGHRVGDNAQVRALAEGLGWPTEIKEMVWRHPLPLWTKFYGRRATLEPLAPSARAALGPPWPDLVVAIGWRSVPVARWIAAKKAAALVHLGRPRAPLEVFDLVLTTPQYGLPSAPNLVRLPGPLGGPSAGSLAGAGELWRDRLAHLPRPWIALMVGGSAPPLFLGAREAADLARKASALARDRGGSLLVTTGPRTGPTATQALLAAIEGPAHTHLWGDGAENPYTAYLSLADEFAVTGDSVSMMFEASRTGRPLHIHLLPGRKHLRALSDRMPGLAFLRRAGHLPSPRRAEAVSDALIAGGQAVPLGRPWIGPPPNPTPDPMVAAVGAVTDMMRTRP